MRTHGGYTRWNEPKLGHNFAEIYIPITSTVPQEAIDQAWEKLRELDLIIPVPVNLDSRHFEKYVELKYKPDPYEHEEKALIEEDWVMTSRKVTNPYSTPRLHIIVADSRIEERPNQFYLRLRLRMHVDVSLSHSRRGHIKIPSSPKGERHRVSLTEKHIKLGYDFAQDLEKLFPKPP